MEEFLKAFGWEKLESKNPHMESYIKEDMRMNYYKTGTVTIQNRTKKYDKGITYRDIKTVEQMENLLANIH